MVLSSSLFVSSQSTSLPSLDPPVSFVSPQFPSSVSLLPLPSVVPRVPWSSPSAWSAAASSSSCSAGPHVSFGSQPGTLGTSGSYHEDVLH